MTPSIEHLNDSFFEYVKKNQNADDITKLLLKKENVDFDKKFAILQIECRKKTQNKLPEILKDSKFLFPKAISSEQCTHELVAKFHSSLFSECDDVLDMTMGLGIDDYYISKKVSKITGIEIDETIAAISKYNYARLAKNIEVINANSSDYISNCTKKYSAIFIDPARRDSNNKRLFSFSDCLPNVIDLMPHIQSCTDTLLIKASPMLDISHSIQELKFVSEIWIIAIKNSCKELLFKLDFTRPCNIENISIHTINYDKNIQEIDFTNINLNFEAEYSNPQVGMYLLEPNTCILKSGMVQQLSTKIQGIKKIDVNSHLFISETYNSNFPGRQFVITEIIPFKEKELKRFKHYKELNIATRNFKLTPEQLKKRLGVKDGGNIYLFGTTLNSKEMVLILCSKA